MSKKIVQIITITLLCTLSIQKLDAQIYSASADAVKQLSFDSYTEESELFVFYQSHEAYIPGELSVNSPTGESCNFTWTKYNPSTNGFTIAVKTDNGLTSSGIDNLDEGGYQVQITNGTTVDTSFIAWVMLDNLRVWTEKEADGKLASYRSGCGAVNFVIVAGGVEADSFYYYDPISHVQKNYINNFDIEWTTDNADLRIFNATNKEAMGSNYSEEPPYKDTYYILTATDSLGMVEIDSVLYDTKHTKAEFGFEYFNKSSILDPEQSSWSSSLGSGWSEDGSTDAPLQVEFTNKSLNGYEFEWVFVDTINELTGEATKEYEYASDTSYSPVFTYYTADEYYYPYLISTSDAGCVDTFIYEEGIFVSGSQLEIPNVFTPNGDGENDFFWFKHQSIKSFKITIVDRYGKIVYRDKIEDIYEWEGWNGNLHNKNTEVPVGQYFYVIEADSYDNIEYKDPNIIEEWKNNRGTGGLAGGTTGTTGSDEPGDETSGNNKYTGYLYLFRDKQQF